jgi:RNA polymerase sigma factor (sigma-70 family)
MRLDPGSSQGIAVTTAADDGVQHTTMDHDTFSRTHRADAVRWAVAMVGDRNVAEELAHDSLMAVLDRLDGLDNPTGYLRRTVVNRCASWHRSSRREQSRWRRATAGAATSFTPETSEMLELLARLPFKQRAAVTLRFWADWTDADIAAALDVAETSVRVLVHRGIATLRTELTDGSTDGGTDR